MSRLQNEFSFVITYNKLYRYGKRLFQSRLLVDTADHNDTAQNIRTYLDILNGNPVPYDEAGLALIQKRAFEAACAPKLRISQLATLQRVFHYKTARTECARRAEFNERKLHHKIDMDTFHKQVAAERLDLARRSVELRARSSSRFAETESTHETAEQFGSSTPGPGEEVFLTPSNSETAFDHKSETKNQKSEISSAPSASSSPSALKAFLSPEVIANNALYRQKTETGEIRVIYTPGKHFEIEYCNPADQPALERLHKSAPLRFFEDPTRTQWLPGLRTFGKNPYIPPSAPSFSSASISGTNSTPQTFPSKTEP